MRELIKCDYDDPYLELVDFFSDSKKTFKDDYVFDNKIGEKEGAVEYYKVTRKIGLKEYCVKVVDIDMYQENIGSLVLELKLMIFLNHPCIISVVDSYFDNGRVYIVMDYYDAALSDIYTEKGAGFNEEQIISVLHSVLSGLKYLHSFGVIHRDIRCSNILVNTKGDVVLTDLGSCIFLEDETYLIDSGSNRAPFWTSPELISCSFYDEKVDIWSLGITAIEMAQCYPPLADFNPLVVLSMIPVAPSPTLRDPRLDYSNEFKDFLSLFLAKEISERLTASELYDHEIFQNRELTKNLISREVWEGWSWSETSSMESSYTSAESEVNPEPISHDDSTTEFNKHDISFKFPPESDENKSSNNIFQRRSARKKSERSEKSEKSYKSDKIDKIDKKKTPRSGRLPGKSKKKSVTYDFTDSGIETRERSHSDVGITMDIAEQNNNTNNNNYSPINIAQQKFRRLSDSAKKRKKLNRINSKKEIKQIGLAERSLKEMDWRHVSAALLKISKSFDKHHKSTIHRFNKSLSKVESRSKAKLAQIKTEFSNSERDLREEFDLKLFSLVQDMESEKKDLGILQNELSRQKSGDKSIQKRCNKQMLIIDEKFWEMKIQAATEHRAQSEKNEIEMIYKKSSEDINGMIRYEKLYQNYMSELEQLAQNHNQSRKNIYITELFKNKNLKDENIRKQFQKDSNSTNMKVKLKELQTQFETDLSTIENMIEQEDQDLKRKHRMDCIVEAMNNAIILSKATRDIQTNILNIKKQTKISILKWHHERNVSLEPLLSTIKKKNRKSNGKQDVLLWEYEQNLLEIETTANNEITQIWEEQEQTEEIILSEYQKYTNINWTKKLLSLQTKTLH